MLFSGLIKIKILIVITFLLKINYDFFVIIIPIAMVGCLCNAPIPRLLNPLKGPKGALS
jgi:hypothetical protein